MTKRVIDKTVREDFPILRNNKDLVYINSAVTSLKPDMFLDKMNSYYSNNITSLGQGIDNLMENEDEQDNDVLFFEAINKVADYINADHKSVIPTYGTTDFVNKLARYLIDRLEDGDEIILGKLEHASNILPWTNIINESGKDIKVLWYELKDWKVDLEQLKSLVTPNTKVLAIAQVYNTTGAKNNINDIREAIGNDVILCVDAAQAIGHVKIDVTEGNMDFLYFGAHKAFGPYALGYAYIKDLLEKDTPYNYGGKMNSGYTTDSIKFRAGRRKYMAGTQDTAGVIAFGEAIDYLNQFDINDIEEHNVGLKRYAEELMSSLDNVRIINEGIDSSNLFFEVTNAAAEDVGYHLLQDNIVVRWGSNCVKIENCAYKQHKAVRASFHIHNTREDVEKLYNSIKTGGDFIDALFNKRKPSKICS